MRANDFSAEGSLGYPSGYNPFQPFAQAGDEGNGAVRLGVREVCLAGPITEHSRNPAVSSNLIQQTSGGASTRQLTDQPSTPLKERAELLFPWVYANTRLICGLSWDWVNSAQRLQ